MLGKLLKHEAIATGRIMLPLLGAMVLLAGMANLSYLGVQATDSGLLHTPLYFIIGLFFLGLFAALVLTVVLLIQRFYKNLLKDEGYLMFTLPVSVHALVWAKLLVACLWLLLCALVCALLFTLTLLHLMHIDLGLFISRFPAVSDFFDWMFREMGASMVDRILFWTEFALAALLGLLNAGLLFYAAMAIGQCAGKNKLLMSVLAFLGLRFVNQLVVSFSAVAGSRWLWDVGSVLLGDTARLHALELMIVISSLLKGAVLYVLTVLPLQKRLNLE